jgi:hypothetical protein
MQGRERERVQFEHMCGCAEKCLGGLRDHDRDVTEPGGMGIIVL